MYYVTTTKTTIIIITVIITVIIIFLSLPNGRFMIFSSISCSCIQLHSSGLHKFCLRCHVASVYIFFLLLLYPTSTFYCQAIVIHALLFHAVALISCPVSLPCHVMCHSLRKGRWHSVFYFMYPPLICLWPVALYKWALVDWLIDWLIVWLIPFRSIPFIHSFIHSFILLGSPLVLYYLGHSFNCQPIHCHVMTLGMLFMCTCYCY